MPLKLQQRLIVALEDIDYKRVINPRSGRYYEMTYQGDRSGLYKGDHKLLVGSNGALRLTRGSIADSIPVNASLITKLLENVPKDRREARKNFPNSIILRT